MSWSLDCGKIVRAENEKTGALEGGLRLYHSIIARSSARLIPVALGGSDGAWAIF